MSDDSGPEETSTPAEVVARRKRFLWPAGGVVALIALNIVVIWWAQHKESPAMSDRLVPLDLAVFWLIALVALWKLPQWQVEKLHGLKQEERFDRENEARKTLATILGGAVLLAGLFGTWKNLQVAQEGQITDRFTKAIDQLGAINSDGKPKIEVRLGGIYALERIANESEKDHWPIIEVLCTYVRENAPRIKEESSETKIASHPTADIQAIVTVLGRRNHEHEQNSQRLNLSYVNLFGAHLFKAYLEKARLEGADLGEADLRKADLRKTDLSGADLSGANLSRADLSGAEHLTQGQLELAKGDAFTTLPEGLHMPESWKKTF